MPEPDITSTDALTGAGEEAGEDWSSRLLERDMTRTGRAGDWSSRLLECDMTSTGRDGDGEAAGDDDWSSRFPEKDITRPGRFAARGGESSCGSPKGPASEDGDGDPSSPGEASPISRSPSPAQ